VGRAEFLRSIRSAYLPRPVNSAGAFSCSFLCPMHWWDRGAYQVQQVLHAFWHECRKPQVRLRLRFDCCGGKRASRGAWLRSVIRWLRSSRMLIHTHNFHQQATSGIRQYSPGSKKLFVTRPPVLFEDVMNSPIGIGVNAHTLDCGSMLKFHDS